MSANLLVETEIQILKPIHEVFEAIVDPEEMAHYFISTSTGRLEEGSTVVWSWSDFGAEMEVKARNIEKDKLISFTWEATGKETLVQFTLTSTRDGAATKVHVTENGWAADAHGIANFGEQLQGWVNMITCLKAYLEYGINLRVGAVARESEPHHASPN